MSALTGYKRADGRYGIRNHVLIIPTVGCVNGVIQKIKQRVPGVTTMMHGYGCGGRSIEDNIILNKTLFNMCTHPNVYAVLILALGCEGVDYNKLTEQVRQYGQRVAFINVQDVGGTLKAVEKAAPILEKYLAEAEKEKRVPIDMSAITVGLQCGGSDAFSGSTANSSVGKACDRIVGEGGTVILTETTELLGTMDILKSRAATPEIAQQIEELLKGQFDKVEHTIGKERANFVISPGNMAGGMSTIQEKSLGCVCKAGSTPINEIVEYSARPTKKGMVIMDAPGYDIDSTTAIVAGGSQIVLFTTGRGNPYGYPIAPVIKIASTSKLYNSMEDDMDINAGKVVEGVSLEELGQEIYDKIAAVINGEVSKPEANDQCGTFTVYTSSATL